MSVYAAVYSGIPVFEMLTRQVAVMRRREDSFLNATQILKVAGVEKGKRTKVLEKEVQTGMHEKVQGGYGKYQGTWIPFERGVQIARQYGVEELLRPLFEYAPGPDDEILDTPKRAVPRKQSVPKKVFHDDEAPSRKQEFYPNNQVMRPPPTAGERYRGTLMSVFLNHESHKIPDLLTNPVPPIDLDIDLIIDDQGHTSLHWASALARINILQLLLNLGADPRRVNFNGESALIRAVLVTNNFDNDSFFDLLSLLHPALDIIDKKGRTLIHHIALTAGIKGRLQASRYYLDNLLDWLRKSGMRIKHILDICDKNGDTALNIASRIGNRHLVMMLLKAGADMEIANRAGLRPIDFGLEDANLAAIFQSKGEGNFDDQGLENTEPFRPLPTSSFGTFAKPSNFSNPSNETLDSNPNISKLEAQLSAKNSQLSDALQQVKKVAIQGVEARKFINTIANQVFDLERKIGNVDPDCIKNELAELSGLLKKQLENNDKNQPITFPLNDYPDTDEKVNHLLASVLNDSLVDSMVTDNLP